MYTREQASRTREEFWTRFGKYMLPVLSAEGQKINWINYKTGIRSVSFKMNATKAEAYIGIEITHKNQDEALAIYKLFESLRPFLEEALAEEWIWEPIVEDDFQRTVSRIFVVKKEINIFNESDWPGIISFLKPRIIQLDKFWSDHKMVFEMMF